MGYRNSFGPIQQQRRWRAYWYLCCASRSTAAATTAAKRNVLRVFRFDGAQLVRARDVRLMYTELHARSAFSFLEGASLPEDLALRCVECGMKSMALLDRDGVYGAPRFYLAANKISLRAHTAARRIPRALPESLPPDYTHEIARQEERRPRFCRRSRRIRQRPCVSHRRRRRTSGLCSRTGGNREREKICARVGKSFRPRKCLRRTSASPVTCRRITKSSGHRNCAQPEIADRRNQWRFSRRSGSA